MNHDDEEKYINPNNKGQYGTNYLDGTPEVDETTGIPKVPEEQPERGGDKTQFDAGYLDRNPEVQKQEVAADNATVKPEITAPSRYTVDNLVEMHNQFMANQKEQQKKQAKRQAIYDLFDASRALASMIGTNAYAPQTFNPNITLSEASQQRYDRLMAERKANHDEQMRWALQEKKWEDEADALKYQYEQDAKKNARLDKEFDLKLQKWEEENERKNALAKAKEELYNTQKEKTEQEVEYLKAKIYYLDLGYDLKTAESKARVALYGARTNSANAQANKTNASSNNSSSNSGRKTNPMGNSNQTTTKGGKKPNPMS